jgi:hypothetical protein
MKSHFAITVAVGLLGLTSLQTQACTLWGAAGTSSADGTLLAKNRDWKPDHEQEIRLHHPAHGLSFLALYADTGKGKSIRDGVNEAGLSVVTAEASSLSKAIRDAQTMHHPIMTSLLTYYRNLDDVAADADKLFTGIKPVFLMLGDSRGLMTVEVGENGHYTIKREAGGTMTHTNHYLEPGLISEEQKIGPSSATRYARINTLLASGQSVHTLDEFSRISGDRHDGPDNSLWRNGREYTLAGWQIALPADGPPHLHLLVANPGEAEQRFDLRLDAKFWAQPEQVLVGKPGGA